MKKLFQTKISLKQALLCLFFMCNSVFILNAQDGYAISGTITDESNVPLPGASVLEKGTSQGAYSDFDGNFKLDVRSKNAILVVSFVGYKTQEIPVNENSNIAIVLIEDAASLDEVVIIGYGGTVKKKDLTGAVSKANLNKALETSNVSVIQALQGSISGLNISAVTNAGQNPSISIRGRNTLSSADGRQEPLIVVDGIIYRGNLIDLNPADVASINVLKDASSAAIYGSQASNGVILITTKTGKKNSKPTFNYSTSYSIQNPSKTIRPMGADEYETFYPDIFWDLIRDDPNYDWRQNFKTIDIANGFENGIDTPWYDNFTNTGHQFTHNISVSGRGDKVSYFLSGGYTDQEAFIKNDTYKRYNFRVNLDAKLNDWLKIGTQTFTTVSNYSGQDAGTSVPFFLQPWAPERNEDGEFIPRPEGLFLNPHLTLQIDDYDLRFNIFSNIYADVKLPIEGLTYRMNYSNNYRTFDRRQFDPNAADFTGSGFQTNSKRWDWTFDNILSFKKTFSDDHRIDLTLLYGIEKRDLNGVSAGARNFAVDFLGFNALQAGDPSLNTVSSSREEESSLYQMGRLLYNFKNKYYFTGTVRRDGFSGFGNNNKIALFPSVALGWVITEEEFNKPDWMNFLKLRGSYGKSGRRAVGRYQTLAQVSSGPSYIFGDGASTSLGQSITRLPNKNLKWETTTGLNVGLDFELFNSRFTGNIEYYKNKTDNILFNIALPNITGFSNINTNIAEISNNGIELTLNGQIINNEDFKWNTTVNFSRIRNQVDSILGADNDGDGQEDDLVSSGLFIGEPTGVIYDYEITGLWQLEDEENGTLWEGFFPGTYKLKDLNGDGSISSLDDRKILGYSDPDYSFSIANNFEYKDFSLYVFVNSIQGGKNRYLGSDDPYNTSSWVKRDNLSFSNVPSGAWDYWLPSNPNAKYRRLDTGSAFGGRYYKSRSFVRLQDVTLSYNVPQTISEKLNINGIKVFLSGKNLATWTKWNGQDPETGAGFAPGRPLLKSYTLGLNVQF